MWPKFQRFPLDKSDAHPRNITNIISQNMAAANYSHVWYKMVAVYIFAAFQEAGMEDQVSTYLGPPSTEQRRLLNSITIFAVEVVIMSTLVGFIKMTITYLARSSVGNPSTANNHLNLNFS